MPARIFLIRHGLTQWNLEKRYISFTDLDLIDGGRIQAKKVKERLENENILKVYCSDSKRALSFSKIIFKETIIENMPELREMNFGVFEGLRYSGIMRRYPAIYKRWLKDPFETVIPQGEGLKEFKKRILGVLSKIISENKNKSSAIVTHAGPIRIIINSILEKDNFWEKEIDLASISIIECDGQKKRIIVLNETGHLNG